MEECGCFDRAQLQQRANLCAQLQQRANLFIFGAAIMVLSAGKELAFMFQSVALVAIVHVSTTTLHHHNMFQ